MILPSSSFTLSHNEGEPRPCKFCVKLHVCCRHRPVRPQSMANRHRTVVREDQTTEFERRLCPVCGLLISLLKLEHRFLGQYTCPHCDSELVFSDEPEGLKLVSKRTK